MDGWGLRGTGEGKVVVGWVERGGSKGGELEGKKRKVCVLMGGKERRGREGGRGRRV